MYMYRITNSKPTYVFEPIARMPCTKVALSCLSRSVICVHMPLFLPPSEAKHHMQHAAHRAVKLWSSTTTAKALRSWGAYVQQRQAARRTAMRWMQPMKVGVL